MLVDSYAPQVDIVKHDKKSWENYDKDVFSNLDTMGKCGFVSTVDGKPIGFASWDPRQKPIGIIGQNCILPEYQGQGFGKKQILEVVKILKNSGFERIRVTTGDHKFFVPAHKMYKSCGFKEINRKSGELFDLVEYERVVI